jgi:7,8-dihydropterin-6-yl-methyl-4-(beta-D-ribofuranosyl)aminobenzene 5'-phosphate synthase
MNAHCPSLAPVDQVEVITLYDNLVDQMLPASESIERLAPTQGGSIASTLLSEEKRVPFVGGHGFASVLTVVQNGIRRSLLFDAGGSPDGLIHNMDCIAMQPKDLSCIVLSHGHWDHTLGLIGLHARLGRLAFPLTLHPDAYVTRVNLYPDGHQSRTVPPSRQGLRDAGLELIENERPSFVLEGAVLVTGQVARTNHFECGSPPHHAVRNGLLEPDPLICDDQAVIVNVRDKGLVVLTGCGHAGIINTLDYARSITGVDTVHAIVGGFHLGPEAFQTRISPVVDALVRMSPTLIAPTHCTGYRAMFAIYRALPEAYVQNGVGTRITVRAD